MLAQHCREFVLVTHLAWQCPSGLWSIFLTYMYKVTHPPPLNTVVYSTKCNHTNKQESGETSFCLYFIILQLLSRLQDSQYPESYNDISLWHSNKRLEDTIHCHKFCCLEWGTRLLIQIRKLQNLNTIVPPSQIFHIVKKAYLQS